MRFIQSTLIILLFLAGCWLGSDIFSDKNKNVWKISQTRQAENTSSVKKTTGAISAVHQVKKKDTLFALSLKYAVSLADLRKFNGFGHGRDKIFPGQVILIPRKDERPREGVASWYGPGFHGRRMANGQVYNQNDPKVAAHRELPLGTEVLIINLENQKTATAKIVDRGPYVEDWRSRRYSREIDCSKALAEKLGFKQNGLAKVRVIPLEKGSG